jgi:hypothetical protein
MAASIPGAAAATARSPLAETNAVVPIATTKETVTGGRGLQIFVRSWRPAAPARGVVGIVHGVKSHGGYYQWAEAQLVARGLAVYTVDLIEVGGRKSPAAASRQPPVASLPTSDFRPPTSTLTSPPSSTTLAQLVRHS